MSLVQLLSCPGDVVDLAYPQDVENTSSLAPLWQVKYRRRLGGFASMPTEKTFTDAHLDGEMVRSLVRDNSAKLRFASRRLPLPLPDITPQQKRLIEALDDYFWGPPNVHDTRKLYQIGGPAFREWVQETLKLLAKKQ